MRNIYVNVLCFFFFFKQKTAYEIRKGDWSSDVCSSDLRARGRGGGGGRRGNGAPRGGRRGLNGEGNQYGQRHGAPRAPGRSLRQIVRGKGWTRFPAGTKNPRERMLPGVAGQP